MPFYSYRCSKCENTFEEFHSMSIKLTDCVLCQEKECLNRIPGNINVAENSNVGKVVNDFIKSVKEEIKADKERLPKQEYKK